MKLTEKRAKKVLENLIVNHTKFLNEELDNPAEIVGITVRNIELSDIDLSYCDIRNSTFIDCKFTNVTFKGAHLHDNNFTNSVFTSVQMLSIDGINNNFKDCMFYKLLVKSSRLRYSNFTEAKFFKLSNMIDVDLSGSTGLVSPIDFMEKNFEKTKEGYIAYKSFNTYYNSPESWNLVPGEVIQETPNCNRFEHCGCGINVAPLSWMITDAESGDKEVWKVLIKFEWLPGIVVPYIGDGKVRCERVKLIEKVEDFSKYYMN